MMDAVAWVIAIPIAYLFGSISIGIIVGKLWRGVDVRSYGSGSSGASNVLRTLGRRAGASVLLLDIAKGALPVGVLRIVSDDPTIYAIAGLAVVVGHMFPAFARFKGGKGIATGLGALLVLSPIAGGVAALGFVIVGVTRYVSIGSLIGTTAGLATLLALILFDFHDLGYLWFDGPVFALITIRHSSNIGRLIRGEERRLAGQAAPRRTRPRET